MPAHGHPGLDASFVAPQAPSSQPVSVGRPFNELRQAALSAARTPEGWLQLAGPAWLARAATFPRCTFDPRHTLLLSAWEPVSPQNGGAAGSVCVPEEPLSETDAFSVHAHAEFAGGQAARPIEKKTEAP